MLQAAAPADSSAPPAAPAPRRIDDPKAALGGAVPQGSYEEGVRGRVAQAQSLKGPLDGGWLVQDEAGQTILRLQLVDPGFAAGKLEGVWLDAATGGPIGTGFIDSIVRDAFSATFRMPRGTLVVKPGAEGGWSGELRGAGGARAVTMIRP